MKKLFFPLLFGLIMSAPISGTCQFHKISGTLVAFDKFPLKHVKIKAKKAKTEVLTDDNGHFELVVKDKDVIQVNDPIFYPYSKKLKEDDKDLRINLFIKNDDATMEAAVNEGYITNADMDYGRNNLWKKNNVFYQFRDVYEAIKYAIPSATIIYEGTTEGVSFRGTKSILHSNRALILVDGQVIDDPSDIQPSVIYRITKLSHTAAALYGSRAANGVISIETR